MINVRVQDTDGCDSPLPQRLATMQNAQIAQFAGAVFLQENAEFQIHPEARSLGDFGSLFRVRHQSIGQPLNHLLYVNLRDHVPAESLNKITEKVIETPVDEELISVRYRHLLARARLETTELFEVSFWAPIGLPASARSFDGSEKPANDWFPSALTIERCLTRLCRSVLRADTSEGANLPNIRPGTVWADRKGLYLLNDGAFHPTDPNRTELGADLRCCLETYLRGAFALAGGSETEFSQTYPLHFWDRSSSPAELFNLIEDGLLRRDLGAHILRGRLLTIARNVVAISSNDIPIHPEPLSGSLKGSILQGALKGAQKLITRPQLTSPQEDPNDATAALALLERVVPEVLTRWLDARPMTNNLWQVLELAHRALQTAQTRQTETNTELVDVRSQLRTATDELTQQREELPRLRREIATARNNVQNLESAQRALQANLEDAQERAKAWEATARASAQRVEELKEQSTNGIALTEEITERSETSVLARASAFCFDLLLVLMALGEIVVLVGRGDVQLFPQGLGAGQLLFGWIWLAGVACLGLSARSVWSPGRWLLGQRMLRLREEHSPQRLSLSVRFIVSAFHYGPIIALVIWAQGPSLLNVSLPVFITSDPNAPRGLTGAAWCCFAAVGWLALNALTALLGGTLSSGCWRRGTTAVERLFGVGVATFPVDESEPFRALYAKLDD